MRSNAGRIRLLSLGYLRQEDLQLELDWDLEAAAKRALHKALLSAVKKKLQQSSTLLQKDLDDASGTSGGTYRCVAPLAVACRAPSFASPLLSPHQLATLASKRIVVADGVVPDAIVAAAAQEFRFLHAHSILQSDSDDVCNPLQCSFDLPIWNTATAAHVARDCPTLAQLVVHLFTLPLLLERTLQLDLRVPQTVMLAAYPPGAHYRRHFDSYGGRDIPRYVTCLLYVAWEPGVDGQLRAYTRDGVRDIDPRPGRLCVFFAQEVEHEVLPSTGERYAITLWIWSKTKDDQGR